MKAKFVFMLVSVILISSLLLAACGPTATPAPTTAAPTTASNPDTIIIGTTDKVASLDPADA